MTSYANASSETSNDNNDDNTKDDNTKDNTRRNKKTQALSALLSATALGMFLEGCGGGDTPASASAPTREGSQGNPFMATADDDTFTGSAGADWVSYAKVDLGVVISLRDDPTTAATTSLGAEGDTLINIQNIIGTDEVDSLRGNEQANALRGGGGGDNIRGGEGDDTLDGGEGVDTLYGDEGKDTLYGGVGEDTLNGGAGNDKLYGGEGVDNLNGDAGIDTLYGGVGDDNLDGGEGEDTFIFRVGDGTDIINDVAGDTMTLRFIGSQYVADDFAAGSARFTRIDNSDDDEDDLVFTFVKDGSTDQVTINNAYNDDSAIGTENAAFTINIQYGTEGNYKEIAAADGYWSILT